MNKDTVSRLVTILLWIAAVLLWVYGGLWYFAAAIFIIHLAEVMIIGIRTGRENGRTVLFSAVMTMIFGVTWWAPLRRKA